jgi:zinc/manganese transport system substrate-binding protein
MHHFVRKLLVPLAAAVLSTAGYAADKIPVVASFSILGDLVRVVGGERVSVSTLVGPNEDAHEFEPKPADAKSIVQSKLFVVNGLGFEHWAQKLAKSANYKGATVVASTGVKARTMAAEDGKGVETDPHAWQNPENVVLYVRNIATGLGKLDPEGAAGYKANSEAYVKELQTLDSWAKAQFASLPKEKRKVITSHDAFGYFAAHYGIRFLAPQGISTDAEPSAKQVAQLITQIQREKIRAVFLENMGNPKLLEQISKDAGATVGASLYADALSVSGQTGATYLEMARYNVSALLAGMQKN